MLTAWVGGTLIAELPLPPGSTVAVPGIITFSMDGMTSCFADSDFTVGPSPTGDADFVTVAVAGVVSEFVVAGPAKLGAGGVEVVTVALHPDTVGDFRDGPVVIQSMPVCTRVYDARVPYFLDQIGAW